MQKEPLTDQFTRTKRKLRISVTDRCNLACSYCMPDSPEWMPRREILDFEEILSLAGIFVERLGIEKIRVTGGEPLLRRDLPVLIEMLGALRARGLRRLSLTTNGTGLAGMAGTLRAAGLDDVNVSLDTLDPDRFREMTGGDVGEVLAGIEAAESAGLCLKVNAVVVRGQNDEGIVGLVRWALERGIRLRFIEFMPLDGKGFWKPGLVVPESEILSRLEEHFTVTPADADPSDPSRYYLLDGSYHLGIISTVSNPFCGSCDRLRLTADGRLLPCLFSLDGTDLKAALRAGQDDRAITASIRRAVYGKQPGFVAIQGRQGERSLFMNAIGG